MAKLKRIWIEGKEGSRHAIRFDWDNDRHQRIEIIGCSADEIISCLEKAVDLITAEKERGTI